MFIWAADPFARAHATSFISRIEEKLTAFAKVPSEEP
jgi:hypothetical protein